MQEEAGGEGTVKDRENDKKHLVGRWLKRAGLLSVSNP